MEFALALESVSPLAPADGLMVMVFDELTPAFNVKETGAVSFAPVYAALSSISCGLPTTPIAV